MAYHLKLAVYEKLLERARPDFHHEERAAPDEGLESVEPAGRKSAKQFTDWAKIGVEAAASLPPK